MENVLQNINRKFISLPEEQVIRNKRILESVVQTVINKMKTKDPMFRRMYRRVFYGGSFYDGLRVGRPEEFDLDLLLDIPLYSQPALIEEQDIPGFVQLQVRNFDGWMRQPEAMPDYKNFEKLFDNGRFLSTDRTLRWMKGIVQRSLNDFPYTNGAYILENEMGTFRVTFSEAGPALTLHVYGSGFSMDIDLVTCFVFSGNNWPMGSFRSNPFPSTRPEFFIVPKKPKISQNERYWRLSFQEQERDLIRGKERLKSALKLHKKLRDNLQHNCIASYYIKTAFLHSLYCHDQSFWNRPLSQVFMITLREYQGFINNANIPYYWNANCNLIGGISAITLQNINGRLAAIIRDVENHPDQPERIARYLLSNEEYNLLIASDPQVELVPEAENYEKSRCAII